MCTRSAPNSFPVWSTSALYRCATPNCTPSYPPPHRDSESPLQHAVEVLPSLWTQWWVAGLPASYRSLQSANQCSPVHLAVCPQGGWETYKETFFPTHSWKVQIPSCFSDSHLPKTPEPQETRGLKGFLLSSQAVIFKVLQL